MFVHVQLRILILASLGVAELDLHLPDDTLVSGVLGERLKPGVILVERGEALPPRERPLGEAEKRVLQDLAMTGVFIGL